MRVDREGVQSCLTVYASLMALMVYGNANTALDKTDETSSDKPCRTLPKRHQCIRGHRVTYIIQEVNGCLIAAHRGHHAKPRGEFNVRGHFRHYKSGKVVWIAEHRRGTGDKKRKTYKMGGTHGETKEAENVG